MSHEHVNEAAEGQLFLPRKKFAQLAFDHVPFDEALGREEHEARVSTAIASGGRPCIAVTGPQGAGKSSLIAKVCGSLSEDFVALRVPVVGADDPTSVRDLAAMTLSSALDGLKMAAEQEDAIRGARADQRLRHQAPSGIVGGKLGGGPIPAELNVQFDSLREEARTDVLAGDRLYGIDRLVSILVAGGREPVLVLEDTEAAIGNVDAARAAAFFDGPIRAFIAEVDAALLIAIQDSLVVNCAPYEELRPNMVTVAIPDLGEEEALTVIKSIIVHRLDDNEIDCTMDDVFSTDGLARAARYYHEFNRSLRHTLATLQGATAIASDAGADLVGERHVVEAAADWLR